MWPDRHLIYQASNGAEIYVCKGKKKSQFNFRVRYKEPGKRVRTPKHIHLIIDLYMKRMGDRALTDQLVDHIIHNIIRKVTASTSNPPVLQVFSPQHVNQFQALNTYGEYPVDFLLVVTELIMIQEKTNYPAGVMNLRLYERFRQQADIFSVVSAATFRGK